MHILRTLAVALTVLATTSTTSFAEHGINVGFANVVEPDPSLKAEISRMVKALRGPRRTEPAYLQTFFSPVVDLYERSRDPLQSWKSVGDINADHLAYRIATEFSTREPLAIGMMLAAVLSDQAPLGAFQSLPGKICAPANFQYRRRDVIALIAGQKISASALRFSDQSQPLYQIPDSNGGEAGRVPPRTLFFVVESTVGSGWAHYRASNGVEGYARDIGTIRSLAQKHVCFSRNGDGYRIDALFGFGLD